MRVAAPLLLALLPGLLGAQPGAPRAAPAVEFDFSRVPLSVPEGASI